MDPRFVNKNHPIRFCSKPIQLSKVGKIVSKLGSMECKLCIPFESCSLCLWGCDQCRPYWRKSCSSCCLCFWPWYSQGFRRMPMLLVTLKIFSTRWPWRFLGLSFPLWLFSLGMCDLLYRMETLPPVSVLMVFFRPPCVHYKRVQAFIILSRSEVVDCRVSRQIPLSLWPLNMRITPELAFQYISQEDLSSFSASWDSGPMSSWYIGDFPLFYLPPLGFLAFGMSSWYHGDFPVYSFVLVGFLAVGILCAPDWLLLYSLKCDIYFWRSPKLLGDKHEGPLTNWASKVAKLQNRKESVWLFDEFSNSKLGTQ